MSPYGRVLDSSPMSITSSTHAEGCTATPALRRRVSAWRGRVRLRSVWPSIRFRQDSLLLLHKVRLLDSFGPAVAAGRVQAGDVRQAVGEAHQLAVQFRVLSGCQTDNLQPHQSELGVLAIVQPQHANEPARLPGTALNGAVLVHPDVAAHEGRKRVRDQLFALAGVAGRAPIKKVVVG